MIKAIVTDIEGTTSSIRFVHEVLFPYARENIGEFIHANAEDLNVVSHLNDVRLEVGQDLDLDGVVDQLVQWIDEDKKITPLKALQGMIWEEGYYKGELTGHLYDDAIEYLRKWHDKGIKLYVFSSGSVQAQKLLFGHCDAGDLTPLFSGYYDTRIGNKREADAYRKIVQDIGLAANEILFLSDIVEELDAAKAAGMKTIMLVRDESPATSSSHTQVNNFSEIDLNH
jgi:enolase-phosphatase E1